MIKNDHLNDNDIIHPCHFNQHWAQTQGPGEKKLKTKTEKASFEKVEDGRLGAQSTTEVLALRNSRGCFSLPAPLAARDSSTLRATNG